MESYGVAEGALSQDVDEFWTNACAQELSTIRSGEIDAAGLPVSEQLRHFRTYGVAAFPDARSDGGPDIFRIGLHFPQRFNDDACRRPAPSGVHSGDRARFHIRQ